MSLANLTSLTYIEIIQSIALTERQSMCFDTYSVRERYLFSNPQMFEN